MTFLTDGYENKFVSEDIDALIDVLLGSVLLVTASTPSLSISVKKKTP